MAQVKLILREDVIGLGDAGDMVSVKPGYARNYLLPTGKAILATEEKVRELEHHRRVVTEKLARERQTWESLRQQLEGRSFAICVHVGEEGKLFGSVTAAQIAEILAAEGFAVDRRKLQLAEPIKQVGEHAVSIKLHRDVTAKVKLTVSAAES